ncbi:FadR/GntR family transcriptional regulator [Agreia sp. Leaf210]|uniref:FadR/GntR family transcriptional regulator n=1 Tax=Agreia sp. Leaf210 TaxID=1735682 RepID=UPI0006F33CAF|nr:GntR family transcriptional regulator [Agreia sp. Leaf210]KQM59494.1 GntR family transcriptional regulator [Agreia sp. Leaf210]
MTADQTPVASHLATPIVSSSRSDEITDRLITAIAVGEYLPGSKLPPERTLAASLKVGRMAVRQALAVLVEKGLLETQRGRGGGSFVREQWGPESDAPVQRTLSARLDDLRDTLEAVGWLHGTIARAAASRRTPDDIARLRECLAGYRSAESGRASQKADEQLHLAIGRATHNATLQSLLLDLESRVSISAPAHLWGSPEGMRDMELRALGDHDRLVTAIVEGRADDAGRIASEHVHIDLELIEAALARSLATR